MARQHAVVTHHVEAGSNDTLTFYLNGMLQCATAFPGSLADLDDVNNWIGRSQFAADPQCRYKYYTTELGRSAIITGVKLRELFVLPQLAS